MRRRKNMRFTFLVGCAALLILVPSVDSLRCYTCLFPAISPIDCLKFITPCGTSQRCFTSVTRGHKGALELVIHEKSCGDPSMCGAHGTRSMFGANFTYDTFCCSTDLCNRGSVGFSTFWGVTLFTIFSHILVSFL